MVETMLWSTWIPALWKRRNTCGSIPGMYVVGQFRSMILEVWKEVSIKFILKAGNSSSTSPKDLRPVRISSFLLKTLDRLVGIYYSVHKGENQNR